MAKVAGVPKTDNEVSVNVSDFAECSQLTGEIFLKIPSTRLEAALFTEDAMQELAARYGLEETNKLLDKLYDTVQKETTTIWIMQAICDRMP